MLSWRAGTAGLRYSKRGSSALLIGSSQKL